MERYHVYIHIYIHIMYLWYIYIYMYLWYMWYYGVCAIVFVAFAVLPVLLCLPSFSFRRTPMEPCKAHIWPFQICGICFPVPLPVTHMFGGRSHQTMPNPNKSSCLGRGRISSCPGDPGDPGAVAATVWCGNWVIILWEVFFVHCNDNGAHGRDELPTRSEWFK